MAKPIYKLFRESNWGDPRWVLCANNSSPFGRYPTATAARNDAKQYGLKVVRATELDSLCIKGW